MPLGEPTFSRLPSAWRLPFFLETHLTQTSLLRFVFGRREDKVYNNPFRAARMAMLLDVVDEVLAERPECRILDLGGEPGYWQAFEDLWGNRNLKITLVNQHYRSESDPRFTSITGNACGLPEFADNAFDIVHSNSVIEHVGGWGNMREMAGEVRRLAPRYFVQTPNFWFPIEPHYRTPFIHWLPRPAQVAVLKARACGFYPKARNVDEACDILAGASLLDAEQMAFLFPDGALKRERLFGFTKSLIAIRSGKLMLR